MPCLLNLPTQHPSAAFTQTVLPSDITSCDVVVVSLCTPRAMSLLRFRFLRDSREPPRHDFELIQAGNAIDLHCERWATAADAIELFGAGAKHVDRVQDIIE